MQETHSVTMGMLGGAALFLFGLQVLSGALLMLYYQPSETTAYESIERIVAEVPFGRVVRSVHVCGANFFIAVVGLHFLVKLFTRAYRKPREITWVSGVLLLFAALGFGFSGYLLPWNELSYFATNAGTAIAGTLPGDWVVHRRQPDEDLQQAQHEGRGGKNAYDAHDRYPRISHRKRGL